MTRYFLHKAWLGGTGLIVGLAGMVLELRPLVWVALILLGTAFVLRILERRSAVS